MSADRFEYHGINHLALVCRDMAETVRFYEDVLDMPLVKTIDLPDGGQHFFFDIGNETLLAFFWFPDNSQLPTPGTSAPAELPGIGDYTSDVSSMNHVAITVPLGRFDEFRERLVAKGIQVSEIMNHDNSKWQVSRRFHDGVWLRSVYFFDPNGVLLEFAALTRKFTAEDVEHEPKNAEGQRVSGIIPSRV